MPSKVKTEQNEYLVGLVNIPDQVLSVRYLGKIPEKRLPTVAIVGSRKPTSYGKEITLRLARELAERGVVIVSGLALGHDALAHRGALDGGGITIGVVGHGLDTVYPRANEKLYDEIIEKGGAILSEYANDFGIYPVNFLQRNRIVAGLADVVVVVEANLRSGTLNTAAHALEQGREVMAVPGNITSPLSAGCNALIKQGAAPVTCVEDILEKLNMTEIVVEKLKPKLNPHESKIYDLIKSGVIDGDKIQNKAKLSASDFSVAITMMEINGIVINLGANTFALK